VNRYYLAACSVRRGVTIFPYVDKTDTNMHVICDIALEIEERVTNLTIDCIVDVWCYLPNWVKHV
jgi:hypothetical protein